MTWATAPVDVATRIDDAGRQWVLMDDVAKILAARLPAEQPTEKPAEKPTVQPVEDSSWLNPTEAAKQIGSHPDVITAALRDGRLHGHQRRRKGRWIVHPPVLNAWVGHKSEGEQKALCPACTAAPPVRGRAGAR